MKKQNILILGLLASLAAQAEDPPPLPPNPFSNLPTNNEGSFSPFDEDDEEMEESRAAVRPGFSRGGSAPIANTSPPRNSAPTNSGGNQRIAPANAKELVENFDYPDAEILDVAKAIAKLTGKNFIYNPQDIKGRISVVSQTPITVGDAWNAFLTALNMKNFALVPSGKYLRIERISSAKEKQTPIFSEDKKTPNNEEFITRVIPLRYIDASEFEAAFRLWMPREARMQAYTQTNTIIITDTASHINRMLELIGLLDVAGYQESLVVVPVKNAPAKDIAKLIEQILNDRTTGSTGGAFNVPRPQTFNNAAGARGTTSRRGRSGGSSISKIIADDRTNSLILKANAAGILEIRALVRRLDQKTTNAENSGRIHVIRLQFTDAEALAKTLQSITTGSGGSRTQNRAFPVFGEQQAAFQGEIKVAADKGTQSLLVTASPQDFAALKKVVENLDVPKDQVYIEALILEMKLNKGGSFGTSFVSATNGMGLPSASGALAGILSGNPFAAGGLALGFKSGRSREVSFGSGDEEKKYQVNSLNGLIELVQGNTDTNVVATPKIVALDNEDAVFTISETIKVPNNTSTTAGAAVEGFTDDTVKTELKVTPQINKASNFVKLKIDQTLENFDGSKVPEQLRGKTLGRNGRMTKTQVVVQNEDTVVLSGLIRDEVEETITKVPLLGDIPILGWLFKNSKSIVQKTNLLVFITPTIIKQYDSIRKVVTRNIDERNEFIKDNFGSRDPSAKRMERLKNSLPDLTVIEPLPQAKPLESSSFNVPSAPDRYEEEDYYDPYQDGGVPLNNFDQPMPEIGPADNFPPPPITPQPQED